MNKQRVQTIEYEDHNLFKHTSVQTNTHIDRSKQLPVYLELTLIPLAVMLVFRTISPLSKQHIA